MCGSLKWFQNDRFDSSTAKFSNTLKPQSRQITSQGEGTIYTFASNTNKTTKIFSFSNLPLLGNSSRDADPWEVVQL